MRVSFGWKIRLILSAAVGWPSVASSQERKLVIEFRAGAYAPAADLGVNGEARARMQSAPAVGVAIEVGTSRPWLSARVNAVAAVGRGLHAFPTAQCRNCVPTTYDFGRAASASIEALFWPVRGATSFRVGAGAGVRGYFYSDVGCSCEPGNLIQGGTRFMETRIDPAVQVSAALMRQIGTVGIVVEIADNVSRFWTGRTLHDLFVTAGVRWNP